MPTEYELKRLENIKRNQEQLKELGLSMEFQPPVKPKPKRTKPKLEEPQPKRVSLRQKGITPEGIKVEEVKPVVIPEKVAIEGDIDIALDLDKIEPYEIKENKYKDLSIPIPNGSVKTTKEMIYTMAMHPSKEKLLAAMGDKQGNLVFWNVSDTLRQSETQAEVEPELQDFKPHVKPISKVMFQENNLIMSSYDASIRQLDVNSSKIVQLYLHPDKDIITHFDCYEDTIWFSTGSGECGLLDKRAKKPEMYEFSEKKLNTIDLNPNDSNYLLVSGLDRTLKIFDIRKLKKTSEPVLEFEHQKSVNSAYWDPNGKHILSTSFDDTLGLFQNAMTDVKRVNIRHNNNTVWKPTEPVCCIGNMSRSVDLFDENGEALGILQEERLTAIPAVNVFHPTLNIIVSGNASGRACVWV
ncbi:WD repeat-containing protein [Gorgonomyces haynaldii]|nr:WD repeat-containing protein [Gorgonomyces haynaldii]